MDFLLHDVRHAARSLRRSWWFASVTVLTLGLGVGVITALFAVISAVLLHPIAVDQDRVVRIWKHDVERGAFRHPLSYAEFTAFREQTRRLVALVAIQYADASTVAITIDDYPTAAALTPVSADFFPLLFGGQPLHGRWFQPADEVKGAELIGVVSERFWRRAAAADPAFVGRRLQLAGGARTLLVIGIAPAELDYPLGTDVWVPIAGFFDGSAGRFDFENRRFAQFELLGRLAPGVSADRARAELEVLYRRLIGQFPDDYRPMRIVVQPLLDTVVGNSRQVLLFLFAAAGLVLVIGGVNVASLLLMRAASRRRELAIRLALGASHARLARQSVTDSFVLGALAAGFGVLLAQLFLAIARWLAPDGVPRIDNATLDTGVLGFCVAAVLAWVLTLGTMPVWAHRRLDARPGELSSRGRPRTAGLRLFTIAEIAAAVVVAIGAGLLVRSFLHLQGIDRGFDAKNLAVITLLLPDGRYPDARSRVAFFNQLLPHLDAIPGVIAAAPIHFAPGTGSVGLSAPMMFEGQTSDEAATNPWATWDPVTPSYFRTFGVPIVAGRAFTNADGHDAAPVAIVSEAVARRYWPGQDPVGKRLRVASEFPWVTVVGVAADLRYRELTKSWLTVYFPAAQFFFFSPTELVVRTVSSPEGLVPAIRQTIRAQEPHVAISSVATMDALLAKELSRPRTAFTVAALFTLMAILLAAVGVFSVMSYEVTQRQHELAVRSALGASPARLFRDVVGQSLSLAAAGAFIGITAASFIMRSIESLLFDVKPGDPRTFVAGAAVLLAVVLLASSQPARRAASADPVTLLRTE